MTDIVIAEFMEQSVVDTLAADFNVDYAPRPAQTPDMLAARLRDARALIVRNRTRVTARLIARAPKLSAVGRLGVGLDNIDIDACEKNGVAVYPAYGGNDKAVAEYVIAAALMLRRRAFARTQSVINGEWPREQCIGGELGGKTLGLVGCGATGRETAQRARAMDMTVIGYDPALSAVDGIWRHVMRRRTMDELLSAADALSVHAPLNDETRGLIDRAAIARMKPGAILINTARGGIVDEAALVDALKKGHLGGAALDVFTAEPVDKPSGGVFADAPNLILTPHIAGVTEESNRRVSAIVARRIREHLHAAGRATEPTATR